jgi:hypothetical protein
MRMTCFPIRFARQGRRSRPQWLAFAALLAQLQIVWLAGFHYHPELAGAEQSRPALVAYPGHPGSPADDSRSCAFCQIVRHSTSTQPLVAGVFFHTIFTNRLAAVAVVLRLPRPYVRLAGRDPPLAAASA